MGWLRRAITGDKRGTNPASLATLAQINAERRRAAARAVLENDPSSPPPATPTPPPPRTSAPPVTNDADFFQRMEQYEAWRLRVYEAEANRRRSMMEEIRAAIESEMDDEASAEDPVESALVSQILPILAQKFLNGSAAAPVTAPKAPQSPVFSPEYQAGLDAQKPQESPQNAPDEFTVEQAREIIANLEQEKPSLIKRVRAGKFSKSEVFAYLALQGVPRDRAELLYSVVMEPRNHTEQEGEE